MGKPTHTMNTNTRNRRNSTQTAAQIATDIAEDLGINTEPQPQAEATPPKRLTSPDEVLLGLKAPVEGTREELVEKATDILLPMIKAPMAFHTMFRRRIDFADLVMHDDHRENLKDLIERALDRATSPEVMLDRNSKESRRKSFLFKDLVVSATGLTERESNSREIEASVLAGKPLTLRQTLAYRAPYMAWAMQKKVREALAADDSAATENLF